MPDKTITIRVTEDEHREIKIKSAQEGKSIKEYLLALVRKDLDGK